ncbi:butyrate kinase [Agrilactobacillus fermenti]|uniref:butyrate kinase n=1 Tax=Agrilactobacillus fermenti TaxID=2586909 RepID=UPI001E4DE0B2|nr:butyrate kinase [Agrilactobacillus fermenti]MCD2257003.1 butyrate kinase [Agrilactobacillus fermenti]
MANNYVLVINPGSTTTKISIYQNETELAFEELRHEAQELAQFSRLADQLDFRYGIITKFLQQKNFSGSDFIAVVGRGGLLRPITGGTYRVSSAMIIDLTSGRYGVHASNLGGLLADKFAAALHIPAYIVDSVVTDEFQPVAYISGNAAIPRRSVFHALNQKAAARAVAAEQGWQYDEKNLIVVHMGGGVTVGAHQHGRVVDATNGLDGEGPFGPNRTGALPGLTTLQYVSDQKLNYADEVSLFVGEKAGLMSYFGTQNLDEIMAKVKSGNAFAKLVFKALAYQIAKEIGVFATVLTGQVDGIVLTGGMAFNDQLVALIKQRTAWIAPIFVHPGQSEMAALNHGVQLVLAGQAKAKDYLTESQKVAQKQAKYL